MNYYFLNDDHTYRLCTVEEWSSQIEVMLRTHTKHVSLEFINDHCISTVWLGIDHNFLHDFLGGDPLVFETMVFDPTEESIFTDRYSSWSKALEGHKNACELVLAGCKENY